MRTQDIFLSVVVPVGELFTTLANTLEGLVETLSSLTSDFEVILVVGHHTESSVDQLREIVMSPDLSNIQVFSLTQRVSIDEAYWVGVDNSLGDFVVLLNPHEDDPEFIAEMLAEVDNGSEIVFASNTFRKKRSVLQRVVRSLFNRVSRSLGGIDVSKDAPRFRLMSRSVITRISKFPRPHLAYRHLPLASGFKMKHLRYRFDKGFEFKTPISDDIELGLNLLFFSPRVPLRLVTGLALLGAAVNAIYALYVFFVWLSGTSTEPGWVSLSLQFSGMFLLVSLALFFLGEFLIQIAKSNMPGPSVYMGEEFSSPVMRHKEKKNIKIS